MTYIVLKISIYFSLLRKTSPGRQLRLREQEQFFCRVCGPVGGDECDPRSGDKLHDGGPHSYKDRSSFFEVSTLIACSSLCAVYGGLLFILLATRQRLLRS